MGITVSHTSALELLRAARVKAGEAGLSLTPTDIAPPVPDDGENWTTLVISELRDELSLSGRRPLDVLVPDASRRIHNQYVTNHVWTTKAEGLCFLDLGNSGVVIPSPEVLVAQVSEDMSVPETIVVAHELCGCYTLRPSTSNGSAVFGVPPVTTEENLRSFFASAKHLRGRDAMRTVIPRVCDGSLSPQESCLSAMAQLPTRYFGYQIGMVNLNRTVTPGVRAKSAVKAASRTPDILFRGTKVGINYDGEVHVDLPSLVTAAKASGADPSDKELRRALDEALEAARNAIAADKQRDRDLTAMGYTVLAVSRQDLETIDDLDLVMRQVIVLIERTTGRNMSLQKRALDDEAIKEGRKSLLATLRRM